MFIFLIALVAILVAFLLKNYSRPNDYPPGPFCFPLIGSWYSVPGQGIVKKVPEWREKYGNIIGHKIGQKNLVVITGYKEVASALKNNNFQNRVHTTTVTSRTFFKPLGLFFGDGEQYSEVRRFTIRFLGQVAAEKLESVTHEEMMKFFSTLKSGEIRKVDGEFVAFAMNILFIFLIGDSLESLSNELKTFRERTYSGLRNGRPTGIENLYPLLTMFYHRKPQHVANEHAQNFFRDRLKEHRESFNDEIIRDYIDAFLVEQEKEKLIGKSQNYTDEELVACGLDLGQASAESVGSTIAFLFMYVALHPQVQDKIHQELDSVLGDRLPVMNDKSSLPYCDAVIEETMRINTIAPTAVPHIAIADTEFYGYIIPEGTMIAIPLHDIFKNAGEFDDPDSFKPERFTSTEDDKSKIISFGLGKRSCVAKLISRKTLFLCVTYFFQKYYISLPEGYKRPDTEPLYGFTNCPKPFHLIITERDKI